jgi:hypothetical protein
LKVELDCDESNINIREVSDMLPEAVPRYICYSYKHAWNDGRVSFPLCFIFYCPPEIQPTLAMLYSSTKNLVCNKFEILKVCVRVFCAWLLMFAVVRPQRS